MTDCSNPTTPEEKSICACEKQFEVAKKQIADYNRKWDQYEKDIKSYDEYKALEQQKNTCTGNYKGVCDNTEKILRSHYRVWNNCVPDNDVWNIQHNDWCVNDTGSQDYRHQTKRWGGGCSPGFNRGVCVYTDAAITRKKKELLDQNVPVHKVTTDKRNWGSSTRPSPPTPGDINVTCCAQSFGDINASGRAKVNFGEISQNCNQTINKQKTMSLINKAKSKSIKGSESQSLPVIIVPLMITAVLSLMSSFILLLVILS